MNDDVLAQYADWRANQSPPPAISTLRNERTALNDLFGISRNEKATCATYPRSG